MKNGIPLLLGLALIVAGGWCPAYAQSQGSGQEPPAYGWQLMSEQERREHRERMRNAATEAEREAIRWEHHERMRQRAAKMGVELPEQPRSGRGQGPGMGMGKGQGPGFGKGSGKGRGSQ